jgi:hypothetical protein
MVLHAPQPARRRPRFIPDLLKAIGLVVAAVAFADRIQVMEQPGFVPRLRIVNPTAYDLDVDVTTKSHDGWMPVWVARRDTTTVAEEIYDIGETWVFRFSAQGETSTEVALDRQQLERNGWRLEIPASIGDELRDRGAPAPP